MEGFIQKVNPLWSGGRGLHGDEKKLYAFLDDSDMFKSSFLKVGNAVAVSYEKYVWWDNK